MLVSVFIKDLVDKYTAAIKKADPKGSNDLSWNKSVPGFTIIKTPINPSIIAKILWIPIFSPRIGTANKAAIIGALCAIAIFSESNKYLIPNIEFSSKSIKSYTSRF